ncbi:MAG TPA: SufE family protein [Pirellulales bacterium]
MGDAATGSLAERISELESDFAALDARERLELLVEYAEDMPALPPEYAARRAAGENRISECQTPVFLWVETSADRVSIAADVAPEAPTVKGFVALMKSLFDGVRPAEVASVPADLFGRLGLDEAMGRLRQRGMQAVATRIRRAAEAAVATDAESEKASRK